MQQAVLGIYPFTEAGTVAGENGTEQVWRLDDSVRSRYEFALPDNPGFWPALLVIVALPLSLLILSELHGFLVRAPVPMPNRLRCCGTGSFRRLRSTC